MAKTTKPFTITILCSLAALASVLASGSQEAKQATAQPEGGAGVPSPGPRPAAPPETDTDALAGKGVDLARIAISPAEGSPYLGPTDAPVIVNFFSDFQCPVCNRSADPIKQLVVDFPGQVKVVFRNNALASHARSTPAALAAIAAGKQGKFWQYYDSLFASQGHLDDAMLRQTAQEMGLDMTQWEKDIADPRNVERVRSESASAVALGATGTPAFFFNGTRQLGWGSYVALKQMVRREIAACTNLATSGTPQTRIPAARIRSTAERNTPEKGQPAIDPEAWVQILTAD